MDQSQRDKQPPPNNNVNPNIDTSSSSSWLSCFWWLFRQSYDVQPAAVEQKPPERLQNGHVVIDMSEKIEDHVLPESEQEPPKQPQQCVESDKNEQFPTTNPSSPFAPQAHDHTPTLPNTDPLIESAFHQEETAKEAQKDENSALEETALVDDENANLISAAPAAVEDEKEPAQEQEQEHEYEQDQDQKITLGKDESALLTAAGGDETQQQDQQQGQQQEAHEQQQQETHEQQQQEAQQHEEQAQHEEHQESELPPVPMTRQEIRAFPNFAFQTLNRTSAPDNVYVTQMHEWAGNFDMLEINHAYIQWLFPLFEPGMNHQQPPMTKEEAFKISQCPLAKSNMIKSFKMMLNFWGFQWDEKTNVVSRCEDQNHVAHAFNNWMCSHNDLRVTRCMKSFYITGQKDIAMAFLRQLFWECSPEGAPRAKGLRMALDRFWLTIFEKDPLFAEECAQMRREMATWPSAANRYRY